MANEFLKKILAPLTKYAPHDHNHDTRYYTEAEVNDLLKNISVNLATGMPDYVNARLMEGESTAYKTNAIFKVNVPGYLYVYCRKTADYDNDYSWAVAGDVASLVSKAAFLASDTAANFFANIPDSRTATNTIHPITPGTSTYVRFVNQETKSVTSTYFIPCVGIADKISATQWFEKKGNGTAELYSGTLKYQFSTVCDKIFGGDWRDNFSNLNLYYKFRKHMRHFFDLFKGQEVCYA